jgi:hypothetical protein
VVHRGLLFRLEVEAVRDPPGASSSAVLPAQGS